MPAEMAEQAEEERREKELEKFFREADRVAGIKDYAVRLRGGLRRGGARR